MKMTDIWKKIMLFGMTAIIVVSGILFFIGKKELSYTPYYEKYSSVEVTHVINGMTDGTYAEQYFENHSEFLEGIIIRFATYGRTGAGNAQLSLTDQNGVTLAQAQVDVANLVDNHDYYFNFQNRIPVEQGGTLCLTVRYSSENPEDQITLWAGPKQDGCSLLVNGEPVDSSLYFAPTGYVHAPYVQQYLALVIVVLVSFLAFCLYEGRMDARSKCTPFTEIAHIFVEYKFLLKQLVSRDFKNKYRRSYLGVLWSLLNPLFMMVILSAVFSYVFRFSIQNFQVYLILGQVAFNFYSEATQLSIMTVVGSGQLIKKVYLPKYIFTVSKVLFSFVNFGVSCIAVLLVMAYYRIPVTPYFLYLPVILVPYFFFILGVSFFLSASMVFLRDTQHLYQVMMTAIGYLTPIFYSLDALAPWMQRVLKLNPLYHYLTGIRTVLLYGAPLPIKTAAICIFLGVVSFYIGVTFFFKKQNRFILYI